jgi:hypothetical protein
MSEFDALAEEQAMEAEALESIFVDDFEQISVSPFHWSIKLQPFPAEDEENHVAVSLDVIIPSEYPNIIPELKIEMIKGLNDTQIETITELANKSAEENVGMAMIYTICEEIKEWLIANNEPPKDNSMFAKMQRRMNDKEGPPASNDDGGEEGEVVISEARTRELEALERNRQKELEGTPVNEETFKIWKDAFDAAQSVSVVVTSDKKTGKEYFATGVSVEDWAEPEDDNTTTDGDGAGGGGGGEDDDEFNDDVFEDEDDLDFSDLEDEEDDE